MDKCGICSKPVVQLFETGKEGVYACFKCQPLVPEVTIGDTVEINVEIPDVKEEELQEGLEANHVCGLCHKSYQTNTQLQNHLRNHRAERRFVCTYCNKAFSQSNNLRAHLRIHTNERPYKCSECGKAFTQVTNLNNHVRLHTGERPFVCPEPGCNKAYAQVTNLNQHRKRHLNGRPVETSYDCNICGEQFDQRNHMYTHRRDAHGDVKPPRTAARHVCKLCDLTFPNQSQLQLHVAQHVMSVDSSHSDQGSRSRSASPTGSEGSSLSCVFKSCGAKFASARDHTEHLLSAHQLRVLAARPAQPTRRGRPPKSRSAEPELVELEVEDDPLEIPAAPAPAPPPPKQTKFKAIKIVNAGDFQIASKLKVQSLFQ